MCHKLIWELIFRQLYILFHLAQTYRACIHKERSLDHVLKVISTLLFYIQFVNLICFVIQPIIEFVLARKWLNIEKTSCHQAMYESHMQQSGFQGLQHPQFSCKVFEFWNGFFQGWISWTHVWFLFKLLKTFLKNCRKTFKFSGLEIPGILLHMVLSEVINLELISKPF